MRSLVDIMLIALFLGCLITPVFSFIAPIPVGTSISRLRERHTTSLAPSTHVLRVFPGDFSSLVALDVPDISSGSIIFALGGSGILLAIYKTAIYFRMQYIVASLLTNRIPKVAGGADILQLSAQDLKALYYLPPGGVKRVILSTTKTINQELADNTAVQAAVPIVSVRPQKNNAIDCPDSQMDAVYTLGGLSQADPRPELREVSRVLKDGGQFILVEKGNDCQKLLEAVKSIIGNVEVDLVENFLDPYTVAVATKSVPTKPGGEDTMGGNRGERRQAKKFKKAVEQ